VEVAANQLAEIRRRLDVSRVELAALLGLSVPDYLLLERSGTSLAPRVLDQIGALSPDNVATIREALSNRHEPQIPHHKEVKGLPRLVQLVPLLVMLTAVPVGFYFVGGLPFRINLVTYAVALLLLSRVEVHASYCGVCEERLGPLADITKPDRCSWCGAPLLWL
jgi:hypothetical protein